MFIVPLLGNAAFDPETVETLSAAFDDARGNRSNNPAAPLRGPHTSARESWPNASSRWRKAASRDRRQLSEFAVELVAQNYKQ